MRKIRKNMKSKLTTYKKNLMKGIKEIKIMLLVKIKIQSYNYHSI